MIEVICLDVNLIISDCNQFKDYFYNLSELGDVNRVFIVKGDLGCDHDSVYETHFKDNLPSLIREYMHNYCNYTIEMNGVKV